MKMKKEQLQQLQAPPELEQRLTSALAKQHRPPRIKRYSAIIAAAVVLIFCTYNFNALAYYGKQLFGYDKVISANLQQLHAEGYGQTLNETITLANGAIITIEGLMADSNQLLIYYKEEGTHVAEQTTAVLTQLSSRFKTYEASGSYGVSTEPNAYRFVATFEPISGFSKKLTLTLRDDEFNVYNIPIRYNANAALPTTLKQQIKETYTFKQRTFTLHELVVTPNSTRLTGTAIGLIDPAEIELRIDDIPLTQRNSATSTSSEKSTFDVSWDTIPVDAKTLEIRLYGHPAYTLHIH